MPENNRNQQNDFMIERIKERPVNKKKLFWRTMTTAAMAVVFGLIACVTFLLLEPVISNWLYPEEEPAPVTFPEDQEEINPEDMLVDPIDSPAPGGEAPSLEEDQIQEILNEVYLDKEHYRQLYASLHDYVFDREDLDDNLGIGQYVVTIRGIISNIDWFLDVQESSHQASGVIIADNGKELLILADYTSLKDSQSLVMDLGDGDYTIAAELKGLDTQTNLAVIAVNQADLPVEWMETGGLAVAPLGSSNANNMVGTPVIAIGSPMGVSGSLGYGMISAVSRQLSGTDLQYSLLQTDIYGSMNANGILFDLNGRVIGIITTNERISDVDHYITAYGISELKGRIQKLSNREKIPYLGIDGVTVPGKIQTNQGVPGGVYIRETEMDSPAMLSGIQPGDILVRMNGENILSFEQYVSLLLQKKPDDTVRLAILRQSQNEYRELSFSITLKEKV